MEMVALEREILDEPSIPIPQLSSVPLVVIDILLIEMFEELIIILKPLLK